MLGSELNRCKLRGRSAPALVALLPSWAYAHVGVGQSVGFFAGLSHPIAGHEWSLGSAT